jgi:hypothetical protein
VRARARSPARARPRDALDVVLSVLDVVAAQDLDLAQVLLLLPGEEVDLLQQLLLVVLELAHLFDDGGEQMGFGWELERGTTLLRRRWVLAQARHGASAKSCSE